MLRCVCALDEKYGRSDAIVRVEVCCVSASVLTLSRYVIGNFFVSWNKDRAQAIHDARIVQSDGCCVDKES